MTSQPPSGTVTFLFTDIEGSTKLWESHPEAMRHALVSHDEIVRASIEANGGFVFKTVGDSFYAAFATAQSAVAAALDAQLSLIAEPWEIDPPVRSRMALHTGAADERGGDYYGQPVNRVARLLSAGHGGQTLVALVTQELVRDTLTPNCTLTDLGDASLKDLARPERVYQLNHPDLPSDFPPLRTLNSGELPNNLPQQPTSFIGREKEMADIESLLLTSRLLTLVGTGGAGKTRLALQAAADLLDGEGDGVWLVELAPLSDPALVPDTVAQVLGVKEVAGQTIRNTLVNALKTKSLLIVLDNAEHVAAACAALVADLLRSCPGVHLLVTSREPLGIPGEQVYRVPSLSMPSYANAKTSSAEPAYTADSLTQYESVRLFVERAKAAQPAFAVTDSNAPAVAQVCYHLDGIPLAIELAAARVRLLTVEEVNARLDQRFRLLTGGSRTLLPRQQTLQALIDWSYDLLGPQDKLLLQLCSVFAGGWTLEAVEQVCADVESAGDTPGIKEWDVLDHLTSLADKSLVTVEEREDGATSRYHLLETIRQYGAERLRATGEAAHRQLNKRHADYFCHLAEQAEAELKSPQAAVWAKRLDADHDNLLAAILWCVQAPEPAAALTGLRLSSALWQFWSLRGYFSLGRRLLADTLHRAEALDEPDLSAARPAQAKALNGRGALEYCQGDYAASDISMQSSLQISRQLGDQRAIAAILLNLGNNADVQGDTPAALAYWQESLEIRRKIGDTAGIASSLCNLGASSIDQGEYATAREQLQESLDLFRRIEYPGGTANTLQYLGYLSLVQGDYTAAETYYRETLEIRLRLGDVRGAGIIRDELAATLHAQGDIAAAEDLYRESLQVYRQHGMQQAVALSLNGLAEMAIEQGRFAQARHWLDEALEIGHQTGAQRVIATSLHNLGNIANAEGDPAQARVLLQECLQIRHQMDDRLRAATALASIAEVELSSGQAARAVTLRSAAASLMSQIGAPLTPTEQQKQQTWLSAARQSLTDPAAYESAWTKGQSLTLNQAVTQALSNQNQN